LRSTSFEILRNIDMSNESEHHVGTQEVAEVTEPFSRTSTQSAEEPSSHLSSDFEVAKTLFIKAHGLPNIRKPGPSEQTEIEITSLPSDNLIYTSKREGKWASSTQLFNSLGVVVGKVNSDRFSNGLFKTIEVEVLGGEHMEVVKIKRRAIMTRACVFTFGGCDWEWRYGRKAEGAKHNGHTLLVLGRSRGGIMETAARLVRDEEAAVMGDTKSTYAGRGGKLELGRDVVGGGEEMESVVVMSALIMLKKEVDRKRQIERGYP
jgi:hypothetical protein